MRDDQQYPRFQSKIWDYGERLAAIWAADPGCMPYGRYRGHPVAAVLRDPDYLAYLKSRWEAGLPDPPELIAAIRRLMRGSPTGKTAMASVEFHDGGCIVYRPAIWSQP